MSNKLKKYKALRYFIIGILLFVAGCATPTSSDNADKVAGLLTETETEFVAEVSTETEAESASEFSVETEADTITEQFELSKEVTLSIADIPEYSGNPYVEIRNNVPQFLEAELSTSSYEYYSELDELGRCGVVYACIGTDLMPTEERGKIGSVKPTGWHTIKYDVVDGLYLYNRCHLIGYQLSGENANVKNLITGTRYMNIDGMSPFENMVASYVQETENHVMYRVTPIYDGDNLLASGVQIEAQSVEDNGEGILFNVYCYNVQPGVEIDYVTGDSWLIESTSNSNSFDTSNETTNTSDETTSTSNEAVSAESNATTSDSNESQNANSASDDSIGSSNESASGASSTTMVWKSATGEKYHSINNCGRMNPDKATQITEEQAISMGLGKCSKCW